MHRNNLLVIVSAAILAVTVAGCNENENARLATMAEKNLDRQVEQNRRLSELQREVAEGSRRLVEADAKAREQMVAWQRDIQTERTAVGRQRDLLEEERRQLAARRRLDPIIAVALSNLGLLLACLLPLVVCCYLLHRRVEPADDQAVAEVLIADLVADKPLLLPRSENGITVDDLDDGPAPRLSDQTDDRA
ncbi:MAG: hypothetical protein DWQ42_13565 [Planctomycetota bacterium]|nr:MAG: hypothetical protein DWQ42_13565 [Planctomycetota bacterium]REK49401.1 MAG: hypothetical protein DWQ46_00180 [Planctomycetota bacterium]